jgi:hypothetical protein
MTSLEKLDTKMAALGEIANKKLEEMPASVQGSWGAAIRNAKDELKAVQSEYRGTLLRNAVAILVNGDKVKAAQFVALAKEEGGIVVDANALYERLAGPIEQTFSDIRTWGIHQSHMLHKLLQEVMADLSLNELPMPARSQDTVLPTHGDVVEHVRKLIVEGVGNELNALYIEQEAARQAFAIRYTGVTAPILLVNASAEEASALAKGFGKGELAVTINSDDEINKEYLAKTLRKQRKK